MNPKKIKAVVSSFILKYLFEKPYSDYMNLVSDSTLGEVKDKLGIELGEGETLEEVCLLVGLRKEPPEDLDLPLNHEGFRVFYNETGELTKY